ncbi:MAG: hypothetical protein RLZZ224_358 [Verrucomicrobiota bacterium]|jgi:hypothetical protein
MLSGSMPDAPNMKHQNFAAAVEILNTWMGPEI